MNMPISSRLHLDAARSRLRGFFAWWGESLAAWLPERWRRPLGVSGDRLLLQPDEGQLKLRRASGDQLQDIAVLPWPGDAGEGGGMLARVLRPAASELPRWLLLPADAGLRRGLTLPAAARERLREVLGFEIERQTPFSASEVLYDGRVVDTRADGQLQVELVVAPLGRFEALRGALGTATAKLAGVDLADAEGNPLGVNLLPPVQRERRRNPWRWWNLGLALAAVLLLALGLAQVLANRRAAADELDKQVAARSAQAREVSALRQRLVDAVEGGAFMQEQRNARPPLLEVMDELARRLPDGTWLEKLLVDKGQMTLTGLSDQASALLGKLEGAAQWRTPALSGAVQSDNRTGRDRFTVVATLNPATVNAAARAAAAARPAPPPARDDDEDDEEESDDDAR